MFDTPTDRSFTLANAEIVLPDRVMRGALVVEDGVIAGLREGGGAGGPGSDLGGDLVVPGVVDLHTDHVEAHLFPRAGVNWDPLRALMAHDAQVIGAGTTTVFDSLSVGASMQRPERRALLTPLIDALEAGQAQGLFRAEHLVHLRCEICDPETMALVDSTIGRPLTRVVSVMDHTPGDRQSPDIDRWFRAMMRDMRLGDDEGQARLDELLERSARVGTQVRAHVVRAAHAAALPLMSHDDRSVAHVDEAAQEGIAISEFPTTLVAAERARAHGMAIVAGAPNYLRGGSQSGNIAVRDLLAAGLVDILASDYVPRSPIDAAFAIAADPQLGLTLPQTVAMVTRAPARAAGLADRGEIAAGQRADLLRIRRVGGHVHVVAVWRAGQRVA